MAGILQAKKAGYPLDMEGFWLGDKFWIIAAIYNLWGITKRHWCWSLSSTAAASSWSISSTKSLDRPRLIFIYDETGPVKELSKAVIHGPAAHP
ncbi:MAG: hypothetical protein ABSD38_32010 [Syntrophorhabdales bacterium]|jgi:hypothetical protein